MKLNVGYGLNETRPFKINVLRFVVYDTIAVTNSLNCTVQAPYPPVNLKFCTLVSVSLLCFVLFLHVILFL